MRVVMAGQKCTRRQKDVSRLLREKKAVTPPPFKQKKQTPPLKKAVRRPN